MKNIKIRLYAKEKGVSLWKVAEYFNVSEPTLYRNLRREVQDEELYLNAIDKISESEATAHDARNPDHAYNQ